MPHPLIEIFDIADDNLANISKEQIFAMGVEWSIFRNKIQEKKESFKIIVLTSNAQRLEKLAETAGRLSESRPTKLLGWSEIWIGPRPW